MLALRRGEVFRHPAAQGDEIQVLGGSLWITQEQDVEDYVVAAGSTFRVTRCGAVVLSALKSARILIRPWVAAPFPLQPAAA